MKLHLIIIMCLPGLFRAESDGNVFANESLSATTSEGEIDDDNYDYYYYMFERPPLEASKQEFEEACLTRLPILINESNQNLQDYNLDCLCLQHCPNGFPDKGKEHFLSFLINFNHINHQIYYEVFIEVCFKHFDALDFHSKYNMTPYEVYLMCATYEVDFPSEHVFSWQWSLPAYLDWYYTTLQAKRKFEKVWHAKSDLALLIFGCIIVPVGAIGNILVIVTIIWYLPKSGVTNIFLLNLAIGDLLVTLSCGIVGVMYGIYELSFYTTISCFVYKTVYYGFFFLTSSLLTVMAIERYLAICHPMKAKMISTQSRAKKICGIVWVTSFGAAVPSGLAYVPKLLRSNVFQCASILSTHSNEMLYKLQILYVPIIGFVIPALLMAVLYARIGAALYKSVKMSASMRGTRKDADKGSGDETQGRIRVVRMLVIVVVVFVLCWAPYLSYLIYFLQGTNLNWQIDIQLLPYHITEQNLRAFLNTIAVTNSCLNPFLYAFCSRQFRNGFRYVLTCKSPSDMRKDSMNSMSAATRSTNAPSTISGQTGGPVATDSM